MPNLHGRVVAAPDDIALVDALRLVPGTEVDNY
jgi:hypothetical protein